jgi:hypothetical protein
MSGESFRLRDAELEWREVEGEIVALDLRESTYLSVNRTGTVLWPRLAAGATRDELIASLTASFDVDEESAGRDLDAFLGALRERGLLAS